MAPKVMEMSRPLTVSASMPEGFGAALPPELDPAIRAWQRREAELRAEIAARATRPAPGMPVGFDLAGMRALEREVSDRLAREFTAPVPEGVVIEDLTAGGVRVRRYRPALQVATDAPLPTQIWLHGGGFVVGAVDEEVNDRILGMRVALSGFQILSVDYRLAPEHLYPAAVQDALAVIGAVAADPLAWGAAPGQLGLGGASAGAMIAASAALRLGATRPGLLRHLCLEVPPVTLVPHGESWTAYAPLLGSTDALALAALAYLPSATLDDGYAVPLTLAQQGRAAGLPPTTILTAEFDALRDGAEEFGRLLGEAGVPTHVMRGEGHVHASSFLTRTFKAARQWQGWLALAVAAALGPTPA